jgi:hypothetical protein
VEWVPAHCGIPGSERADKLAEKAAKNKDGQYANEGYTSFTHLKVLARRSTLRDWADKVREDFSANRMGRHYKQHFKEHANPHWKSPNHSSHKKHAAAIVQLKTGHGYFRSYLARRDRVATNRCFNSCMAIQSPKHLVLRCPNYNEERKELRRVTKLNRDSPFAAYFQGKKNTNALLEFITNTGVATRDWLQRGGREEEQEDEIGEEGLE